MMITPHCLFLLPLSTIHLYFSCNKKGGERRGERERGGGGGETERMGGKETGLKKKYKKAPEKITPKNNKNSRKL